MAGAKLTPPLPGIFLVGPLAMDGKTGLQGSRLVSQLRVTPVRRQQLSKLCRYSHTRLASRSGGQSRCDSHRPSREALTSAMLAAPPTASPLTAQTEGFGKSQNVSTWRGRNVLCQWPWTQEFAKPGASLHTAA